MQELRINEGHSSGICIQSGMFSTGSCLPELWLRKVFPGVIYANTNIPENHFKIVGFQKEISELPDESDNIFIKNILDRYVDQPDEVSESKICFSEFFMSCRIS